MFIEPGHRVENVGPAEPSGSHDVGCGREVQPVEDVNRQESERDSTKYPRPFLGRYFILFVRARRTLRWCRRLRWSSSVISVDGDIPPRL